MVQQILADQIKAAPAGPKQYRRDAAHPATRRRRCWKTTLFGTGMNGQRANDNIQLSAEDQFETMVPPSEDGARMSNTERNAIAEADEWLKHNQPIPHEKVLTELGLTMDDWEKMAEGVV